MHPIRKILVVLNEQPNAVALQRGGQIAQALAAELHVMICNPTQDHGALLRQHQAHLKRADLDANIEQAWVSEHEMPSAILNACRSQHIDLVIKQHHPDNLLNKLISTPQDWQLLRQLPLPVLLVRSARPWLKANVLAAMDVERRDDEHQALQGNVMDFASEWSQLFDSQLHTVSAFTPLQAQADPCAPIDHTDASHCHDLCQWFQHEYELPEQRLHINPGPAKLVIPQVAHELDAALVVLGTTARHGLSALLLGNTAEAVLDRLDGDMLVLKAHTLTEAESSASAQQAA